MCAAAGPLPACPMLASVTFVQALVKAGCQESLGSWLLYQKINEMVTIGSMISS